MHRLQQDCRSLGQGETFANRFLPTLLKEANVSRNVQIFGSRCSAVRLRCVAFEAPNPCFKRSPARPLVLKQQQQKRTTRIMAQENVHGLGDTLREGYELTDHVVVDENHTIEGTNDVIEKLISGFKTFKEGVFKQKPELYEKLAVGQEPKMMMITCADSRVCPTMLHGLEAGEAFIVRNVANLVPPCEGSGKHHGTSAAIEFAVTVLNVESIIVMGHSSCGGIRALMSRDDFSGDFIGSWVRIGMPAKKKTLSLLGNKSLKEQCSFCEKEAVNVSLANLLTFPFIEERVHDGRLQIYGMHYDFVEGKLTSWRIVQSQVPVNV